MAFFFSKTEPKHSNFDNINDRFQSLETEYGDKISMLNEEAIRLKEDIRALRERCEDLEEDNADLRKLIQNNDINTITNGSVNDPGIWLDRKRRASVMTRLIGMISRENPQNDVMVGGMLYLKLKENRPLDVKLIQKIGFERLVKMPRFRSKLIYEGLFNKAYFETIPLSEIDLSYHFQVAFENETPSREEIRDYINYKLGEGYSLDLEKPLWRMTIIPKTKDGRGLIFSEISHTIGDGVSQVEVLFRLLDAENNLEIDGKTNSQTARPPKKRKLQRPGYFKTARIFVGGVFEGLFALAARSDPKTSLRMKNPLNPPPGTRFALSETISLQSCKDMKNKIEGATLNEIFLVILMMTIRKYFDEKHEKVPNLKASFPMNLRRRNDSPFDKYGDPHNVWGYGFMKFHMKYKDPIDLFWKVKNSTDIAKLSPAPFVAKAMAAMMVNTNPSMKMVNDLSLRVTSKATFMLSNVAGPQEVVHLAGYAIDDLAFQLMSPAGMYLGLISYAGNVTMSVNMNEELGDPEEIVQYWHTSFKKLQKAIMEYEGIITKPKASNTMGIFKSRSWQKTSKPVSSNNREAKLSYVYTGRGSIRDANDTLATHVSATL